MRSRLARAALPALVALVLATVGTLPLAVGGTQIPERSSAPGAHDTPIPGPQGPKELPALTPAPRDALTLALRRGTLTEAEYALQRALSVFQPATVRARFGRVASPDPTSVTMILRDLAIRVRDLPADLQKVARSVLARPTDGASDPQGDGYTVAEATPVCGTNWCVHYVTSTDDAPPAVDDNANGIPDQVDATLTAMSEVWAKEITDYGYRQPKSDITSTNHGPDGNIDIYLADVGADGLYGYCTSDDPNLAYVGTPTYPYWDFSAYCVFDNDYSPAQFTVTSGIPALEVTAAHEFFHAVQFAYDAAEDYWFMEGTATWMEDEVYDGVNDNLAYLPYGQLGRPRTPVDTGKGFAMYGNWIFWRFLSEYFADPTVIRAVWRLADGSAVGPDYYSTQAAARVTSKKNVPFRVAFADFGMVNAAPRFFYEEGSSYPTPPITHSYTITKANGGAGGRVTADHLTNSYVEFRRGGGVSTAAKLLIALNLPPYRTGPEVSAVVFRTDGSVRFLVWGVPKDGDLTIKVPFARGTVKRVVLVLTNASTRFTCWKATVYSCQGTPRDDGWTYYYSARLTSPLAEHTRSSFGARGESVPLVEGCRAVRSHQPDERARLRGSLDVRHHGVHDRPAEP